jgi:hypothetical protein
LKRRFAAANLGTVHGSNMPQRLDRFLAGENNAGRCTEV